MIGDGERGGERGGGLEVLERLSDNWDSNDICKWLKIGEGSKFIACCIFLGDGVRGCKRA